MVLPFISLTIMLTLVSWVDSLNPSSLGSKDHGKFFSFSGSVDAVVEARLHPRFLKLLAALLRSINGWISGHG